MPQEIKKRPMRYSESELELLKGAFADNDELLRAVQKSFFQLPLNAVELSMLEVIKSNKELQKIIRKIILPELTDDTPYAEVWDYQMGIDFRNKIPETIVADIKANKILIDYFDQQLKVLEQGGFQKEPEIKLKELSDIDDKLENNIYIDVLARDNIIGTLAGRLNMIVGLAGQKEESAADQKKRLEQDSNK